MKILWHVTLYWLLGNALVVSAPLTYKQWKRTRDDITNALPSNQDDVACLSIFV